MSDFRKRILEPLAIPVTAIVFIGGLVWGLSRFLLVTDEKMAVVVAFVVSFMILVVAAFMSAGSRFGGAQKIALAALGLGIAAGGTITAEALGLREFHSLVKPDLELEAKGIAFVEKELSLTVVKDQYNVELLNNDPATPHNFAVYRDARHTQVIYKGPVFSGVAAQPNFFKNPGPGLYFFQCDVHPVPNMQGTLTIGPKAPGAASEGGPPPAAHIIFLLHLARRRP